MRLGLEGGPQILGARLLKPERRVIPLQAAKKHVITDEPAQHVQYDGALVVDERAKDARVVFQMTEAIAEIDRTLIGFVDGPARHLADHVVEHVFAVRVL